MTSLDDARSALREADRAIWDEYVRLERDGVRREAIPVLAELVCRLEWYAPRERGVFAETLADAVREPSVPSFPIRYPLFHKIVLPVLIAKYDRNEVGSARLLLQFSHQLHGRHCEGVIGERDLSQWALLDRAVLQEPIARDLQMRWLDMKRGWFQYATHEVPVGVLYGHDGATVAECENLLNHVDEFETRAANLGVSDQYEVSIAEWRYYFGAYREYLLNRGRYGSFEQFLDEHPPSSERKE